jgi:hypothetical protein
MRSRTWRCAEGHYYRLTPTPSEGSVCPICRGRLIEGASTSTVELVPMIASDQDDYADRVMREKPVCR